jgi:hypothetical protein
MYIIINQPQLVKVVKLYLTRSFGNLTPKTISGYPDSVFYVNSDNQIIMEYDTELKNVWMSYKLIWSKLESLFYLKLTNIKLIMKAWLKEHYNLKSAKPSPQRWEWLAQRELQIEGSHT